jgi:hypothetical protein
MYFSQIFHLFRFHLFVPDPQAGHQQQAGEHYGQQQKSGGKPPGLKRRGIM